MSKKASAERSETQIKHYAPDIDLCAKDYVLPISPQQRLKEAEKRIEHFLSHTSPDELCGSFFDKFAEEEEARVLAELYGQMPPHQDANCSIANKHRAEIAKLMSYTANVEERLAGFDEAIAELKDFYKKQNNDFTL